MKVAFYEITPVALNAMTEIKRVGIDSFIQHGVNIRMIRNYEDALDTLELFRKALEADEEYDACIFFRDLIEKYKQRPKCPLDFRVGYY